MAEVREMVKKMCVIGEAAVGKTSLIRRYVLDRFADRYIATIGTKTSAKELHFSLRGEEFLLKLQIWDIIGLRSFAKLQKRAYKGAKGAFFVFDKTRKRTWLQLENWLLSLYETTGEIPVIVLANKNDLISEFDNSEIEKYIHNYDLPCYFTSAKTGENVDKAFQALGEMMVKPWIDKNIVPKLEKSRSMGTEIEPELEPGRALSIFEVEDIIMARYCDLFEDADFAMALINEQYRRADLDFKDPTVERLNKIVEYLIKAASNRVESARLKRESKAYVDLIKMIELRE